MNPCKLSNPGKILLPPVRISVCAAGSRRRSRFSVWRSRSICRARPSRSRPCRLVSGLRRCPNRFPCRSGPHRSWNWKERAIACSTTSIVAPPALNLSELAGLSEAYDRDTLILKYREVRQRHREIERRLQNEARYRSNLTEAKEIADRAIALIDGRNIPLADWQESEWLWERVLAFLEEIPENSFSRDRAAQMLLRYRQNLAFVREQIQKLAAE